MCDRVPHRGEPEVKEMAEKLSQNGKERAEEGKKICVETIRQVREVPGVRGVHIMAIEWEEAVPEIVERAGLLPRP